MLAEISPKRLALVQGFPCDRLVNPAQENLGPVVREETGGVGADVVVVAAPARAPQEQAVELVRKRGTVCRFASLPADESLISLDSRRIHYGELRIVGASDSTPEHVRKAAALLDSGAVPADKLVTHVLPLEAIHTAFSLMERGEALRVVLRP